MIVTRHYEIINNNHRNIVQPSSPGRDGLDRLIKGPSIYAVRKSLGFFDPLPPLSAFGTDLQY